jgi:hypothetical protein
VRGRTEERKEMTTTEKPYDELEYGTGIVGEIIDTFVSNSLEYGGICIEEDNGNLWIHVSNITKRGFVELCEFWGIDAEEKDHLSIYMYAVLKNYGDYDHEFQYNLLLL